MERFTADELRRIQRTLRRRFRVHRRRDILDVGFGPGVRAARQDPERPWCVCFYVQRKRRALRRGERIPRQVTFRLRRGNRFPEFTAATDVIELTPPTLSGCVLSYGDGAPATTGIVVAWRPLASDEWKWGVVTVGHAFPATSRTVEPQPRVVIRGRGSTRLAGHLLARTARGQGDAALVQVASYDLVRCGIVRADQRADGIRVRSVDEVKGDDGAPGASYPVRTARRFWVRAYLPECVLFQRELGRMEHVIHAHRAQPATFERGTSGSLWRIRDLPAAMQFGGLHPEFREGFGQALEGVLAWAERIVVEQDGGEPGAFRFVAAI